MRFSSRPFHVTARIRVLLGLEQCCLRSRAYRDGQMNGGLQVFWAHVHYDTRVMVSIV
jgi:hypothetical protein